MVHSRLAAKATLVVACLFGCTAPRSIGVTGREPIVGGPCEGCEAVFQGLPASPSATARIAPLEEPGEPLRIVGVVRDLDGNLAPGTIVYAYQTNASGRYPPNDKFPGMAAYRHGLLRGWARADAQGRYQFDTVRPGGYPDSDLPQHVHMHVIEPGRCSYYIDVVVFTDDPRLTPDARARYTTGRGGSGVATPLREGDGTWLVTRDIVLGERIPDYPVASMNKSAGNR